MGRQLPRISIITSSYNQGKFIERTLQSVLTQNYSNLEHIIVDNMSTDETVNILARYPHLIVQRAPDQGQADAINKGFAIATGDILCFLNSDDTLAPGALHRVAQEIDPAAGRHIVMGRCRFIDENDRFDGIEHPSYFIDAMTVLKIWQGHGIPQPAVFWSREVLDRCGTLDITEKLVLDYDLFCRFSRHYTFHYIDQHLANYRLHHHSKTHTNDDATRLAESIRVSQRYWRAKGPLFFLRLWSSLWNFRRKQNSLRALRKAKNQYKNNLLLALINASYGSLIGPDCIYYAILNTRIKNRLKLFARPALLRDRYPLSRAYVNYQNQWPDQWIGPRFVTTLQGGLLAQTLTIKGQVFLQKKITLQIQLNGKIIASYQIKSQNNFALTLHLTAPVHAGKHEITILTDEWLIMHHYQRNHDYRPVAWKLLDLTLT